jgi:Fic family protein
MKSIGVKSDKGCAGINGGFRNGEGQNGGDGGWGGMDEVTTFLKESNAIEGVYDDFSLLKAQEAWKYLINQDVLTVDVILKTHGILMAGKLKPEETGKFRKCHVWIGNRKGEHFNFVPKKMDEWVQTVMDMREFINPIGSHIIFERIHPFVDGNGRIGRMFLNWTRLKRTNESLLIIYEHERQEYYKWFGK